MTAICDIYFTLTKVTSFVDRNVYTSILFSFSFSKEYRWQGSWQPQRKLESRCWPSTVYAFSPHNCASSNNCTTCLLSTHTMFTGPDLHRFCRCRKHGVCMTSHSVIPCTMLVSSVQLLLMSTYQRAGSPPEVIFRCIYQPPAFVGTYADANHQSLPQQLLLGRHLQLI
jgi:hypothetical protein